MAQLFVEYDLLRQSDFVLAMPMGRVFRYPKKEPRRKMARFMFRLVRRLLFPPPASQGELACQAQFGTGIERIVVKGYGFYRIGDCYGGQGVAAEKSTAPYFLDGGRKGNAG
jgi:hypothetical protein